MKLSYLSIALGIVVLFMVGYCYRLNCKCEDLAIQNKELQQQVALEKANNIIMQSSIKAQNLMIEQYRKDAAQFKSTIEDLTKKVESYNESMVQYDSMTGDNSSEEAIKWLQEKASSL